MLSRAKAVALVGALSLAASPVTAALAAGPVILLEADSGRVLYAEDQDHQWYPASLTKIMTAYLTFAAIKAGRLKLNDTIEVSEKAHAQSPSRLGLPVGGEVTVDLAIRSLIVKSANDVAVMLAEKIAGSEEAFVQLMNDTAKRLGMSRTRFVNPNGLPAPEQVSTARDLARLARAALADFPDQRELWALTEVRIGKQRLKSHNRLLGAYDGADGIKTGFICDSGFNIVSSATRDGRRLLAVVLGDPSGSLRNARAATLLDHGFQTADWKALLGAPTIDSLPLDPAAKAVASVRSSVVAWNCSGRKPVRRLAKKKPAAKAGKAVAAETSPQPAAAGGAGAAAAPKPAKGKAAAAPAAAPPRPAPAKAQ